MQADARALVTAQRNEIFDALIAPDCGSSRRRGPCPRRVAGRAYRYLIARNADEEGFYLVWDGPRAGVDFTEDVYEACAAEALTAGLKPVYHVWSRFNLFWTGGVIWHQVPAPPPRVPRAGHGPLLRMRVRHLRADAGRGARPDGRALPAQARHADRPAACRRPGPCTGPPGNITGLEQGVGTYRPTP
jgi:hypothetical protein